MSSKPSSPPPRIDKLDFDANRNRPTSPPSQHDASSHTHTHLLSPTTSIFTAVVDGAIHRDQARLSRSLTRTLSFATAILACLCAGSITAFSLYGPLFLSHLKYSQYQVNAVSTAAELGTYLPVPALGWLVDRYNPRPLSLASGVIFGVGYGLAAGVYGAGPVHGGAYRSGLGRDGERDGEGKGEGGGWPFWVMVVAFVMVGMGTCSMYLAAVTTCAKNFGRGRHRGIALAVPIAAFGLSGMWQSLVGNYAFREQESGDLDVFRYFCFLGGLLFAVGVLGGVGLRVVDEEELINEGVGELERSGLLEGSALLGQEGEREVWHESGGGGGGEQHGNIGVGNGHINGYGTIERRRDGGESVLSGRSKTHKNHTNDDSNDPDLDPDDPKAKKSRLLNAETRIFLTDPTTYLLAAGFFLTTGPGEAYLNNIGTLIHTLYPPNTTPPTFNSSATHVSIVALTSTLARLATGTLSDLFAPTPETGYKRPRQLCTLPRPGLLIAACVIFSLGQLFLATPLVQHLPKLLPVVTAFVGLGYGAVFSLTPMLISVVWGVQNFGTNWGIIAVVPAGGAAMWGAIYSAVYSAGTEEGGGECFGGGCYMGTFAAMVVASWAAIGLWVVAWRKWRGRGCVV